MTTLYIADWYHKVDNNIGNEVLCNHLFPIKHYTVDIFLAIFRLANKFGIKH